MLLFRGLDMKKMKYFFGMLFLSLLLIMQIAACSKGGDDPAPGPTLGMPFITSDLAGTWYLYGTNGASVGVPPIGSIDAGHLRGKLILDSLGQVPVTGSSFTRSTNQSVSFTGGVIGMDSAGVVSGSATTNLGVYFYFDSGKMDASKNILSFVVHTSNDEHYLITAIRAWGGFSSLDLVAMWHVFSAGGDHGQITVSDAGNGIRAPIASPGGGGFFAIDGNGLLNDTYSGTSYFVTGSGTDLYLKQGKINLAKDIMFFVAGTDPSNFDLVTAIRAGGTFAVADLSGTWFIDGSSSSSTDSTKKATLGGTMILDSSGKVTGGSYMRSDTAGTASFTLTSGTVTIDNAGVLGGSAGNMTFTAGKMNAAKGMMSLVGSIGSGEQIFLFCLKGN
jgi:hypothetical protein